MFSHSEEEWRLNKEDKERRKEEKLFKLMKNTIHQTLEERDRYKKTTRKRSTT